MVKKTGIISQCQTNIVCVSVCVCVCVCGQYVKFFFYEILCNLRFLKTTLKNIPRVAMKLGRTTRGRKKIWNFCNFKGIQCLFELVVNMGIYTKSGGVRVVSLGNVVLKKINFFKAKNIGIKFNLCEPRWVGQVVGHLVSKCLSQVRLGVLPSLSPGIYTLKKPHGPAIYPTRAHSSRTMISLWLKVLRIHCEKPPKKQKQKFQLV